jgi:hypothetical protein
LATIHNLEEVMVMMDKQEMILGTEFEVEIETFDYLV